MKPETKQCLDEIDNRICELIEYVAKSANDARKSDLGLQTQIDTNTNNLRETWEQIYTRNEELHGKLDKRLEAIERSITYLQGTVDTLTDNISGIMQQLHSQGEKINEIRERRIVFFPEQHGEGNANGSAGV